MRIKTLLLYLLLKNICFSQVESITIKKDNYKLYQGVESEITNWYLFIENDFYYLANLELSEKEILDWFFKRKNSQNIFKGKLIVQEYQTLSLIKENEPETMLNFYVELKNKETIILSNMDDTRVYTFKILIEK